MVDPLRALLVFGLLCLVTALLFWPKRGVVTRVRRTLRATERVRIEDAVKYLYHAGDAGVPVRPEALAGALSIGDGTARALLTRLTASGLARPEGTGVLLTESGRQDALRLVRTHRLVERWLADQTGVEPGEWHEVAEDAEHELSVEEVERLAARMGQPRYDPHGDPIPTATGELPVDASVLVGTLAVNEAGVVAHLEDEPAETYKALRAAGLALGKTLVLRARDASTMTLEIDGARVLLPRLMESAVSVLWAPSQPTTRRHSLAELEPGESARVVSIDLACHGAQRRRLLDLGVVPGTEITAELRSAGGDPMAYLIRGALIGLRRQQAAWIEVEPATASERAA